MARGSLPFYLKWSFRRIVLRERIPLTGSVIVTDRCNLQCRHCVVANLGDPERTYEELCGDIKLLYDAGIRMLVLTGGEPLIWRDGARTVEDLITAARKMGFFRTVICTNGTLPLDSRADYLWVSLDGSGTRHDELRNSTITNIVIKNIKESQHPGIKINYTNNGLNISYVMEDIGEILSIANVKDVFIHIMTPYIGLEDSPVRLDHDDYGRAVKVIYEVKKKYGGRVINSYPGIKALATGEWERPVWGSLTVCNGQTGICCCRRGIYNEDVCKVCGCTPAVETWALQSLSPGAIVSYLRYL